MNSKNKRILLFLCLFIVIIILLDMIFNFSGSISHENFAGGEKVEDFSKIKSVISKAGGRILNINVSEVVDSNTSIINIKSPTHSQKNIEVSNRAKLIENIVNNSSKNQRFLLKKIESIVDYNDVLENTDRGLKPSSSCTKYPFYVILYKDDTTLRNDKCLGYENGMLILDPVGNYTNQKWDVSTEIIVNTMAQCGDTNNNNTDNLEEIKKKTADREKININFNLDDKIKDQLFS